MENTPRTSTGIRVTRHLAAWLLLLLITASAPAWAGEDILLSAAARLEVENAQLAWQRARLLHPSEAQLRAERDQQVFIYVAVTDRDVEAALDNGFERMGSFVFANVVVTGEDGQPLRDPQTGRVVVESEDCD